MTQEEFFKRYKYDVVEDRIGGGGFGTVYKAYDTTLHHEVAIKVSEVKTTNGKTFSLRDEVEALTHVPEHPNIANYEKEKLFTFKSPQGVFDYAVMQFYPDGNLSNAIKEGMTEAQKEDVATQLLEGIGFLHDHKVVHRDLKPGNILIVRDGDKVIPLITDFGLSKAANAGDGSVFTNSFGGGTPRYSSPEQLQGQPLRFNTDLWSFGAILYEVFTGQQLFSPGSGASNTAQADMEIFNKIIHGDVQSLGKMPEKWRRVAERCLVVNPEQRAKSAEELLTIIKESEEATEITMTSGMKSPEPEAKPEPKPEAKPEKKSEPKPLSKAAKSKPTPVEPSSGSKSKKGLWIVLLVAAAAIVLAVIFLKPKKEEISLDTQAFNACQTVEDYRDYLSNFGSDARHFVEAEHFIDSVVSDSIAKVEYMRLEDAAYQRCNTIDACASYLKDYPQGRYVDLVIAKKEELEAKAKEEAEKKHVGDLMTFEDGKKGIVFWVNDDGKHGLVVSLDEGTGRFVNLEKGASIPDEYFIDDKSTKLTPGKGASLTDVLIRAFGSKAIAANWARSHGKDWYLPSIGEMYYLTRVANKGQSAKGPISQSLSEHGGVPIVKDKGYSSSSITKCGSYNADLTGIEGQGFTYTVWMWYADQDSYRAVRRF